MAMRWACFAALALAATGAMTFDDFTARYGRQYGSTAERQRRRAAFDENLREIARLNALASAGHGATFAPNRFSDMTAAEFKAQRMMPNAQLSRLVAGRRASGGSAPPTPPPPPSGSAPAAAPAEQNWYLKATTPVRDQGQCGSCWAFSQVEQIESDWFLSGKSGAKAPVELSAQQVVSCDSDSGSYRYGCSGTYAGSPTTYDFVQKNGGLASEADYPYTSGKTGEDGTCNTGAAVSGAQGLRNHSYAIPPCDMPWDDCDDQDEDALAQHVGTKRPLAICVNAGQWQHYASGVMTAQQCGGHDHGSLDHCVQLVGYKGYSAEQRARGSGDQGAYWIVRNSWSWSNGSDWGDHGLIYLAMGNNTCGLADVPSFAIF